MARRGPRAACFPVLEAPESVLVAPEINGREQELLELRQTRGLRVLPGRLRSDLGTPAL